MKTLPELQQDLFEATAYARSVTTTSNYAAAWDVVEELLAAINDKKQTEKNTNIGLSTFCEEDPGNIECRMYDV